MLDIDHGNAIVVGIGDVERFAVRRNAEGVRRATLGGLRKERRVDCLLHRASSCVDDVYRVARGARDEQTIIFGVQGKLVRMFADGNAVDAPQRLPIDDQNASVGPVADVKQAVFRQDDVVGSFAALLL